MMLLFFLLLSSGSFAQRDELKVNRRKRQKIPRLVIQEGPVWASVKPAQAAFKGSDVVDDYQGQRQAEKIPPNSEPNKNRQGCLFLTSKVLVQGNKCQVQSQNHMLTLLS